MANIWQPVGDGEWVGTRASARFPVYTRGNAGEVYPGVFTPLTYSIAAVPGEQAFRNALAGTGLLASGDLAEGEGVGIGTGVFGGYSYLNLSTTRVTTLRIPGGSLEDVDRGFMGSAPPPVHRRQRGDRNLRASLRGLRYIWRCIGTTELPVQADDQRLVEAWLADRPDPATAGDAELLGRTEADVAFLMDLFEHHLVVSAASATAVTVLTNLCERAGAEPGMALRLLGGIGDVESAAPSGDLWALGRTVRADAGLTAMFDAGVDDLADRLRASADPTVTAFVADFDRFVAEHGSRGPSEWDTAFDTWGTDHRLPLAIVDRLRLTDDSNDPAVRSRHLAADRTDAEAEITGLLKFGQKRLFARALRSARLLSQGRERAKTTVVRAIHGSRLATQELDRRTVERSGGQRGDLWFMTIDELEAYVADPAAHADTIAERRRMHHELSRRVPPFFFEGTQPPLDTWELRDAAREELGHGESLEGLGACPGIARGPARVILDPSDPTALEPGDVLVAPITDPAWTPLFLGAAAVVVDVGAVMSHAAIVSRELGIPCVVSATDATRRITDGTMVEVDGATGTVRVLADQPA